MDYKKKTIYPMSYLFQGDYTVEMNTVDPTAPSYLNRRLLGCVPIGYVEPSSHYLGNWKPQGEVKLGPTSNPTAPEIGSYMAKCLCFNAE